MALLLGRSTRSLPACCLRELRPTSEADGPCFLRLGPQHSCLPQSMLSSSSSSPAVVVVGFGSWMKGGRRSSNPATACPPQKTQRPRNVCSVPFQGEGGGGAAQEAIPRRRAELCLLFFRAPALTYTPLEETTSTSTLSHTTLSSLSLSLSHSLTALSSSLPPSPCPRSLPLAAS
ncbi:hypothetical protein MPTK1_7g07810 [Marchantia polymorpha subsp. ruderalis]